MANILMARGGTPDFKGWLCDGQTTEFRPPYNALHVEGTPPFDSHADAAYGQGYLNLHFPLVPNLLTTRGHFWMQPLLKRVKAVGDNIFTNWVPHRSFLNAYYIEVTTTDPNLDGVYVLPVAYRLAWDFTTEDWVYTRITAFDDEITAAGISQFPLGTPADGDNLYGVARLSMDPTKVPSTFGHTLVKRDVDGNPTGGLDEYFGAVVFGLQVTAGDPAKIANIWRSRIAVYTTAKLLAFEGATQVG